MAEEKAAVVRCDEDSLEIDSLDKRWQGTAADKHDMDTLGRVQELRVRTSLQVVSLSIDLCTDFLSAIFILYPLSDSVVLCLVLGFL